MGYLHRCAAESLDSTGLLEMWAPLILQTTKHEFLYIWKARKTNKQTKKQNVFSAKRAAGTVMRRAGVGPQDAVQHARAVPNVYTAPSGVHRRGQLFLEPHKGTSHNTKFSRTRALKRLQYARHSKLQIQYIWLF